VAYEGVSDRQSARNALEQGPRPFGRRVVCLKASWRGVDFSPPPGRPWPRCRTSRPPPPPACPRPAASRTARRSLPPNANPVQVSIGFGLPDTEFCPVPRFGQKAPSVCLIGVGADVLDRRHPPRRMAAGSSGVGSSTALPLLPSRHPLPSPRRARSDHLRDRRQPPRHHPHRRPGGGG